MSKILIEKYNDVHVLRDDILAGGTKSVLMPHIIKDMQEYVYCSPVYGGFQIALADYCRKYQKKATIFCAARKNKHRNTLECIALGANVIEVPYGYMSVLESRARQYCSENNAKKIVFVANSEENINILSKRVTKVIETLGGEPQEIWCAIGSGTLAKSILRATSSSIVNGVQVGKVYTETHKRLNVYKYPKGFDKVSSYVSPFPSMPNYDLKAYEFCVKYKQGENVLFWNVL